MKGYNFTSAFAPDIIAFLRLKKTLGFADKTYTPFLYTFDRLCASRAPDADVVTHEVFNLWVEEGCIDEQPVSTSRRVAALNAFSRYQQSLGKAAYVGSSPTGFTKSSFVARIFSDDEIAALMHAADTIEPTSHSDARHLMLPVMFRLMYCCGLRPNEVRCIKMEDISFSECTLKIRDTKSRKERLLPLSRELCMLLLDYISEYIRMQPGSTWLFERPKGGPYGHDWLKSNFRKAGIKPVGGKWPRAYDFRHTFATKTIERWLQNGVDIDSELFYLKTFLGHERIDDTLYYVHTTPVALVVTGLLDWQ